MKDSGDGLMQEGSDNPGAKAGAGPARQGVRVSTVDNYQGEEARIVLVSLVRSNDSRDIGFLKRPQRVNVLLSRAHDCLILFGNADTLRAGSRQTGVWSTVLQPAAPPPDVAASAVTASMRSGLPVLRGLPVRCERHGTVAVLERPADFAQHAPRGGCTQPCGVVLPCGHVCPSASCHTVSFSHGTCVAVVDCRCAAGLHNMQKRCAAKALPPCKTMVAELCPAGDHTVWRECCAARAPPCRAIVTETCRGLPSGEPSHAATSRALTRLQVLRAGGAQSEAHPEARGRAAKVRPCCT